MKIEMVRRKKLADAQRLDSSFYLSAGAVAARKVNTFLENGDYIQLGNRDISSVWQPNRNTLGYAGEGEAYIPYLQPYDVLEFLPEERSRLSAHQNNIESLYVKKGTILQTCSGRNLGPLVISDSYLEQFAIGSDLIRIEIRDVTIRNYVFAFFNTWIGQAILHSSKTGSVIDHLSKKDIEKIKIPLVSKNSITEIAQKVQRSIDAFSLARDTLRNLKGKFSQAIGVYRKEICLADGWTCSYKDLTNKARLDVAYYDPATKVAVEHLKRSGGIKLSTVADIIKPSGRYKTNYTEKTHGVPLISGRQLLQNWIVGMKYLPHGLEKDFEKFQLHEGDITYPADGRVEGRLGTPVYITKSRDGWYASGHVGRIKANEGVPAGYLYLAMTHQVVQAQIYSLACGAVVDAVYPEDIEKIIIPKEIEFPYEEIIKAWSMFDQAESFKEEACHLVLELLG
jgi:hypothetical protein